MQTPHIATGLSVAAHHRPWAIAAVALVGLGFLVAAVAGPDSLLSLSVGGQHPFAAGVSALIGGALVILLTWRRCWMCLPRRLS